MRTAIVFSLGLMICSGCASVNDQLIKAVERGDSSRIRELINKGANVNAKNKVGNNTLTLAILNNRPDAVKSLIDNAVNIYGDKGELSPLAWAAAMGHKEIVQMLVESGADVNQRDDSGGTALMGASLPMGPEKEKDKAEITEYLIQKGADINAKDNEGKSALFFSTRVGDQPATCSLLIDKGIDMNAKDVYGMTALTYAADAGNEKIVNVLLKNKAIVNTSDNQGMTPLIRAAWKGNAGVVRSLLEYGADVNAKSSGGALLASLTPRGNSEIDKVSYAIARITLGADVDAIATKDMTALMIAAIRGHSETIKLLLAGGADANAKDALGHTAAYYALSRGRLDIGNIIKQSSKIPN